MKKHIGVIILFIAILAGLSYIPLKYYFSDKTPPKLIEHTTYKEALSSIIPEKIKAKAKENKCSHYILPLSEVTGDVKNLTDLREDLNLCLQAFPKWKICVDDTVKQAMIKRKEQQFKIWGSMGVGHEMINLVKTQKNVAMKTYYSAQAKCSAIQSKGNDVKVVLTINDERKQTKLFEISVTFIHPVTLKMLTEKYDKRVSELKTFKKNAKMFSYGLAATGGVFLLYLLSIAGFGIHKIKKTKAYKQYLASEIDKRQGLINDGHFVTALELADKYLAEFPHDTEIKAFRSRLLDYTNNDPEKAQLAYVEWKKLQSRMANPQGAVAGSLLSNQEKNEITKLLPYHPELKSSYEQLVLLDEKAEKEKFEQAQNRFEDVLVLLKNGKVTEAEETIDEIRNVYPDFKKAENLKKRISSKPPEAIILEGSGKTIVKLCFKKSILIGREDDEVIPDVVFEDRRVSRKHLAIAFKDGGFAVTDLESAGGTFVNGDKIESKQLETGDLLNLSKVIDYDVTVFKNNGGLLLKGKEGSVVMVREGVTFGIEAGKIKASGNSLSVKTVNGVVIISTDKDVIIPADGDELTIDHENIRVCVE